MQRRQLKHAGWIEQPVRRLTLEPPMNVVQRIRAWFSDQSKAPPLSATTQSPALGDLRRLGLVFVILFLMASFGWCISSRCVVCEIWGSCR